MHIAQVRDWSEGPRYITVDDPPAPSENQIQLRVLAAGLHQVVLSRASGKHYSARGLPHNVGVDCVGRDVATGKLYYCISLQRGFGSFAELITVSKDVVYALPETIDPASFAASVNPAMSSWLAITQRTSNLPENYTVLILGATTGSGRLAVNVAKAAGAGKVIGVARNEATLAKVEGLDQFIVQKDSIADTDFSQVSCDVILDYVSGDLTVHALSTLHIQRPVQYVVIGNVSQTEVPIPGHVLRSRNITIRGSGPGAIPLPVIQQEIKTLVPMMTGWNLLDAHSVPLKNIEAFWRDKSLVGKGRLVFTPLGTC
jgi:NADPH:quinone reductase-like Zn-dependent oxidoreductase